MRIELKKAIIDYVFENKDVWQLVNRTHEHFHDYIYDKQGQYLIGGEQVSKFIDMVVGLVKYE